MSKSRFSLYLCPRLLITLQGNPETSYKQNSKAAMVSCPERDGFVSLPCSVIGSHT